MQARAGHPMAGAMLHSMLRPGFRHCKTHVLCAGDVVLNILLPMGLEPRKKMN